MDVFLVVFYTSFPRIFFFFAYYHLVANIERCNEIYDTRPLFPRKLFKFPFIISKLNYYKNNNK